MQLSLLNVLNRLFPFLHSDLNSRFLFLLIGVAAIAIIAGAMFLLSNKEDNASGFSATEADRQQNDTTVRSGIGSTNSVETPDLKTTNQSRGSQRPRPTAGGTRHKPLRLEGIRIDGPPHQILGIPITARTSEVKRAYRELMKRYHPDKVGRSGSREWQEAQKITKAIIWAKSEMMKNRK